VIKDANGNEVELSDYFSQIHRDSDGNELTDLDFWADPDNAGRTFTQVLKIKDSENVTVVDPSMLEKEFTTKEEEIRDLAVPEITPESLEFIDGGVGVTISTLDSLLTLIERGYVYAYLDDVKLTKDDFPLVIQKAGDHTSRLEIQRTYQGVGNEDPRKLSVSFTIEKKQLAVPVLKNFSFTGVTYGDAEALIALGVLEGFDVEKMTLVTDKTLRNAG